MKTIKYVYKLNTSNYSGIEPKELQTVYFSLIYGVIAYELITGEVFELEERYFE